MGLEVLLYLKTHRHRMTTALHSIYRMGCKLIEDGGYINIIDEDNIITDENGENAEPEKLGIIEPAWAEDANGKSVNTHYGIDGNTLTQIVEFDEENTFPVVADPEVTVNAVGEKSETSEGKEVVIDVPLPTETDSAESIIKEYAAVAIKCYGKARGKQYM